MGWKINLALVLGVALGMGGLAWQQGWISFAQTGALGSPQLCHNYNGLPVGWGEDPHAGMLRLSGGRFTPGNEHGYPEEAPGDSVALAPFWIDRTEVTNAQFATFVEATGYRTEAELEGAAAVFRAPPPGSGQSWWHFVSGASWRHPEGPGSDLRGRDNHPVVHVTYADALAYANWLGRELPSEAQWEYAARAGGAGEKLDRQPLDDEGGALANYWQGQFPVNNTVEDGFLLQAPVGCYPANGFGLYDMIGNVWELTRDRYHPAPQAAGTPAPDESSQFLVIKGGSFLCAENYCRRYRSTSRQRQERDLAVYHVGFRTVKRE